MFRSVVKELSFESISCYSFGDHSVSRADNCAILVECIMWNISVKLF